MKTDEELKEIVRQKYSEIALQNKGTNASSCCGAGECSTEVYNIMTDEYDTLAGYNAEADLGLGCGLPTQFALIKKGDVVIDLGSGAGNDAFVARHEKGETGNIIGIDFTPVMIDKARCVAGAIQKEEYLSLIDKNGLVNRKIQKEKSITIPDDILSKYLSDEEIEAFRNSGTNIKSITVYAEKPAACCGPDCC